MMTEYSVADFNVQSSASKPTAIMLRDTQKPTDAISNRGLQYTSFVPTTAYAPILSLSGGAGVFKFGMLHASGDIDLSCRVIRDGVVIADTDLTPKSFSIYIGQMIAGIFYFDYAVNATTGKDSYDTRAGGYIATDAFSFDDSWVIEVKQAGTSTAAARLSYDYHFAE